MRPWTDHVPSYPNQESGTIDNIRSIKGYWTNELFLQTIQDIVTYVDNLRISDSLRYDWTVPRQIQSDGKQQNSQIIANSELNDYNLSPYEKQQLPALLATPQATYFRESMTCMRLRQVCLDHWSVLGQHHYLDLRHVEDQDFAQKQKEVEQRGQKYQQTNSDLSKSESQTMVVYDQENEKYWQKYGTNNNIKSIKTQTQSQILNPLPPKPIQPFLLRLSDKNQPHNLPFKSKFQQGLLQQLWEDEGYHTRLFLGQREYNALPDWKQSFKRVLLLSHNTVKESIHPKLLADEEIYRYDALQQYRGDLAQRRQDCRGQKRIDNSCPNHSPGEDAGRLESISLLPSAFGFLDIPLGVAGRGVNIIEKDEDNQDQESKNRYEKDKNRVCSQIFDRLSGSAEMWCAKMLGEKWGSYKNKIISNGKFKWKSESLLNVDITTTSQSPLSRALESTLPLCELPIPNRKLSKGEIKFLSTPSDKRRINCAGIVYNAIPWHADVHRIREHVLGLMS